MEFPITKERLKNFRQNELHAILKKKYVDACVKDICDEVYNVIANTDNKKCIVQMSLLSGRYSKFAHYHGQHGNLVQLNRNNWLPDILTALQERFIDSKVVVDPLNTYILIDWS
jgi:hypothetical protein